MKCHKNTDLITRIATHWVIMKTVSLLRRLSQQDEIIKETLGSFCMSVSQHWWQLEYYRRVVFNHQQAFDPWRGQNY